MKKIRKYGVKKWDKNPWEGDFDYDTIERKEEWDAAAFLAALTEAAEELIDYLNEGQRSNGASVFSTEVSSEDGYNINISWCLPLNNPFDEY